MKIITLPEYFYSQNFSSFLEAISQIKNTTDDILVDATNTKYISPAGLLLIVQFSDQMASKDKEIKITFGKSESVLSWFLRKMGVTRKTLLETLLDNSSEKYFEDIRVEVQRCYDSQECLAAVNKVIPLLSNLKSLSENTLKGLNWALWEILDNAGEHGYRMFEGNKTHFLEPVYFCAYLFKDEVEMAILDGGQGILNSLKTSGHVKFNNIENAEALELSIQNSVSGHPRGSPGFGLYGCSELAKRGKGKLTIISGSNILTIKDGIPKNDKHSHLNGTMVELTIPADADLPLKSIFGIDSLVSTESLLDLLGDENE